LNQRSAKIAMNTTLSRYLVILAITGICATSAYAVRPELNRDTLMEGRRIYEKACAWCHGSEGMGDGPSGWFIGRYSAPRPRDFTQEGYKFRSTASGELPTDQDLFRTLTQGIPSVMPSYRSLNESERWQVIDYIKSLNPAFEQEKPVPIPLPPAPLSPSEGAVQHGRTLYEKYDCRVCHGENGEGNGPEARAGRQRDTKSLAIRATNLTDPTSFKNGGTAQDLYRSIMTGLDGTPMPSYANEFTGQEEAVWDLIWYLQSLSGRLEK